jgi:glycosyltransferase involved in cell wall biosynthesis
MKKIIVRAPILSRSGYGEHARFVLRALRMYEDVFDVHALNINWGKTGWLWEDSEERRWIDKIIEKTQHYINGGGTFDMSVQVTIPNEWEKLAPVNIGITAGIETTKVSPQWIEKSLLMDKIITISEHSRQTYENTSVPAQNTKTGEMIEDFRTKTPFEVVHYPVRDYEPAEVDLDLDYDFNFLTIAQISPRKNIHNTIKWFVEEFKEVEVGLVVKLNILCNSRQDRIETEKALTYLLNENKDRKCKVYLIHGSMTDSEVAALYQHPKIKSYISLAHGEGFGLPIFEAAYNGLPVIAPDWSGHVDFLYKPVKDKRTGKEKMKAHFAKVEYTLQPIQREVVWEGVLIEGSMWCYAKEQSYKHRLREVYKDYNRFKSQAKKLNTWIRKNFEYEQQHYKMAAAINGGPITRVSVGDLPKISIITSVYDGDEFIRPFLEDITKQTVFQEKCELILINANSPGNEEEVINEYLEKYPDNIVYRKLEEDPGIYGVWNMAAEMASGEYLTNANLDDRKAPYALEKHAKELYANEEVDLVYADMWITDQPNETFEENTSNDRRYNFPEFSFENLKMVNMPHSSPMWRRRVHEKHGFFDSKYKSAGDWEMWLRSVSNGSRFKKINDILGLYYFNPKGISTDPENFSWKREEEQEIYEKYGDMQI